VDVWFAEGTSIAANEAITQRIEARLMQEERVETVSAPGSGSGVPRFYLPMDNAFPQSNVSQFIILPKDLKLRESIRIKLPTVMAQEFPEVRARIKILPNGPPVPYPVQFRVMGAEPFVLRERADEVTAVMRASSNTRGVNDNWNESIKVHASGGGPDQGAGAGRDQPVDCTGVATLLVGPPWANTVRVTS
jgi:multidrug efflux pump